VTASPSTPRKSVTLKVDPDLEAEPPGGTKFLSIPKSIAVSSSSETLTGIKYFYILGVQVLLKILSEGAIANIS